MLHANGATTSDCSEVGGGDGDGINGDGGHVNGGCGNDGVSTNWVMWLLSYSLLLSCWSQ